MHKTMLADGVNRRPRPRCLNVKADSDERRCKRTEVKIVEDGLKHTKMFVDESNVGLDGHRTEVVVRTDGRTDGRPEGSLAEG